MKCALKVLLLTDMAGSPVYSTLIFPQKQLPVGMLGGCWGSRGVLGVCIGFDLVSKKFDKEKV